MGTLPTKACKYCADQINQGWLDRHEARCRHRTDEERAHAKQTRIDGRERYRASVKQPVAHTNGHVRHVGRRVSITISVDYNKFVKVVSELFPSLSIDEMGVK